MGLFPIVMGTYGSPLAVIVLHINTKTNPNLNPNTLWCTFQVEPV